MVLFLFVSCANKYESENLLFDCETASVLELGLDLNLRIDSIEQCLIEESLLESRSGESYVKFLKTISNPDFILRISKESETIFTKGLPGVIESRRCKDVYKTTFKNGITWRMWDAYLHEFHPKTKFDYFMKVSEALNAEDLSNPFYRQFVLGEFLDYFVLWNIQSCAGPPLLQMSDYYSYDGPPDSVQFKDTLKFYLDTDYYVEVDAQAIQMTDVPKFVSTRLEDLLENSLFKDSLAFEGTENSDLLLVEIDYSEHTAYNAKCNLFDQIKIGFDTVHNNLSQRLFQLPFDSLDVLQQEVILNIAPVHTYPK